MSRRDAKIKSMHEEKRKLVNSVMETSDSRRFMWDLLSKAGIFKNSFSSGDPHITSFNEGRRNMGLYVLSLLHEHAHDKYLLAEKEAINRKAGEKALLESDKNDDRENDHE